MSRIVSTPPVDRSRARRRHPLPLAGRGWYVRGVIPIRTLRAEALSLDEAQFVARHPDPALLIADGGGPPGSDPMAWLGKTVADEDAVDATVFVDAGQTQSPEIDP